MNATATIYTELRGRARIILQRYFRCRHNTDIHAMQLSTLKTLTRLHMPEITPECVRSMGVRHVGPTSIRNIAEWCGAETSETIKTYSERYKKSIVKGLSNVFNIPIKDVWEFIEKSKKAENG